MINYLSNKFIILFKMYRYEKNNNHFFSHITMWLSNHK